MRKPQEKLVRNPKTGKETTFYHGAIRYRGVQKRVPNPIGEDGRPLPGFPTHKAWERAADRVKREIDEMLDAKDDLASQVPTLNEYTGAVHRDGRITTEWPPFTRRLRKQSARDMAQEAIRPLLREFGDRRPFEITRKEGHDFMAGASTNTRQQACKLISEMQKHYGAELIPVHPFKDHDDISNAGGSRLDDPDFEIISDEEFASLLEAARSTRPDSDYAEVQHSLVLAQGTTCARPSELVAMRWQKMPRVQTPEGEWITPSWIDFENDLIHLSSQLDRRGRDTKLKDGEARTIVLPPPLRRALLARRDTAVSEFVFPALRGGRMPLPLWGENAWRVIRATAGMPDLPFYELKHRAITWCATPAESGGLGLALIDAAHQAGHNDGGEMIQKHYLKLDQKLTQKRIRDAMKSWDDRQEGGSGLRAVGE